jgi:hypothetical protein
MIGADPATVLAAQYPSAGKLIWTLACDVMKMERAKRPPECSSEELQRLHAPVISRHHLLFELWQQLERHPAE